jgi:hypothetical protein
MRLEAIATMLGHRSLRMPLTYARIANKTVADECATASAKIDALYTSSDSANSPPNHSLCLRRTLVKVRCCSRSRTRRRTLEFAHHLV